MRSPAFYPLSLILIMLVVALVPLSIPWRALGGGLLLSLWLAGLAGIGRRAAGYLPGHALLFLGLGLVGAEAALYAWLALLPLSLGLELARKKGRRYLGAALYGILWLDIFACLHQLVAVGRGLTGSSLWAWSAGIGAIGLGFVALGIARIAGSPGKLHEPGPGTG